MELEFSDQLLLLNLELLLLTASDANILNRLVWQAKLPSRA